MISTARATRPLHSPICPHASTIDVAHWHSTHKLPIGHILHHWGALISHDVGVHHAVLHRALGKKEVSGNDTRVASRSTYLHDLLCHGRILSCKAWELALAHSLLIYAGLHQHSTTLRSNSRNALASTIRSHLTIELLFSQTRSLGW